MRPRSSARATLATALVLASVFPTRADDATAAALQLAPRVETTRGLAFRERVVVLRVPVDEARVRIRGLLEAGPGPEAERPLVQLLSNLGLLPWGYPLYDALEGVMALSASGFYDTRTREIVLPETGERAHDEAHERATLVHELVHALGDQHFALGERLAADRDWSRADDSFALRALAEGDAVLTELLVRASEAGLAPADVVARVTPEFLRAGIASTMSESGHALDGGPWLRAQLIEPYVLGFARVVDAWRAGGFAAVDALWGTTRLSSEHLLHHDRRADAPGEVALPDALDGERLAVRYELGELGLRFLLASRVPEERAIAAARGWDADGAFLFVSREDGATPEGQRVEAERLRIVLTTAWDDASEAREFAAAMEDWLWAREGAGTRFTLETRGQVVEVVLRPPSEPTIVLDDDPWDGVDFR